MEQNDPDRDLDDIYLDRVLDIYLDHDQDDASFTQAFILRYNNAHHIVVHCLVIVTSQSTQYLDYNYPDRDPDRVFTPDKIHQSRLRSR